MTLSKREREKKREIERGGEREWERGERERAGREKKEWVMGRVSSRERERERERERG